MVSTVTTGIHFVVDVFGGIATAGVALICARKYVCWDSALQREID